MKTKLQSFLEKLEISQPKKLRIYDLTFPSSKFWRLIFSNSFTEKLVSLSMNKVRGLSGRIRIARNFFLFVQKMERHHGTIYSIKWLKACGIALQKSLGNDKLKSLRALEPNLPLPRLINGCPSIINRGDRKMIKMGNRNIIRFWLTLFNIYRIWASKGILKLNTITDPFQGSEKFLDSWLDLFRTKSGSLLFLKDLRNKAKEINLAPSKIIVSSSSSPSTAQSFRGYLNDTYLLWKHEWGEENEDHRMLVAYYIDKYLRMFDNRESRRFLRVLKDLKDKAKFYFKVLEYKKSRVPFNGISQFSLKQEAAGKIRVFALVDSITQSTLKPLHDGIFSLLRIIPNDGTFDQDLSIKRASKKSLKAGASFSYDLTAATDRMPVKLMAEVIEYLFDIPKLGQNWLNLISNRPFSFNDQDKRKHKLNMEYDSDNLFYYQVGQPMGCLSSWAALALTHHVILQLSSQQVGLTGLKEWNEDYELLGDDLTIFNSTLAAKYIENCALLGMPINFSKSIVSPDKPVFEFAKRTIFEGINVSAIPAKLVLTCRSLSERIANAYSLIKSFGIDSESVVLKVLSREKSNSYKAASIEALGLLNLLVNTNLLEWKILLDAIVDPSKFKGEFNPETSISFEVPVKSIIRLALTLLPSIGDGEMVGAQYPFSCEEIRNRWSKEFQPLIVEWLYSSMLENLNAAEEKVTDFQQKSGYLLSLQKESISESGFFWLTKGFNFWIDREPDLTLVGPDADHEEVPFSPILLRKDLNDLPKMLQIWKEVENLPLVHIIPDEGRSKQTVIKLMKETNFMKIIWKSLNFKQLSSQK